MQITGIILAGGKSMRMGDDKALLEIDGKTLLYKAVEFCQMFCDKILISSNNPEHNIDEIRLVGDEIRDCGPMGGIYSSLKQSETDWNFILSVDAVFVEHEFVQEMIKARTHFSAVVPFHFGKKEPLIALYHKKIISDIIRQIKAGNYKMHFLLEKIATNFFDSNQWVEKYPNLFHNVNYPQDLIF